jgi:antitoxin (DNA-binding transcriptional repressor) of toxin-antitoxin stability system
MFLQIVVKGCFMHSITIRDLKNNPAIMTHHLEAGNSVFLTKHGKPIGITLPLDDSLVNQGIKELLFFDLYKKGEISFGKLAEFLDVSKARLRKMFVALDMPVIDYAPSEVEDELKILDML